MYNYFSYHKQNNKKTTTTNKTTTLLTAMARFDNIFQCSFITACWSGLHVTRRWFLFRIPVPIISIVCILRWSITTSWITIITTTITSRSVFGRSRVLSSWSFVFTRDQSAIGGSMQSTRRSLFRARPRPFVSRSRPLVSRPRPLVSRLRAFISRPQTFIPRPLLPRPRSLLLRPLLPRPRPLGVPRGPRPSRSRPRAAIITLAQPRTMLTKVTVGLVHRGTSTS